MARGLDGTAQVRDGIAPIRDGMVPVWYRKAPGWDGFRRSGNGTHISFKEWLHVGHFFMCLARSFSFQNVTSYSVATQATSGPDYTRPLRAIGSSRWDRRLLILLLWQIRTWLLRGLIKSLMRKSISWSLYHRVTSLEVIEESRMFHFQGYQISNMHREPSCIIHIVQGQSTVV